MIDSHLTKWEGLHKAVELIPVERLPLTASIEPLKKNAGRFIQEFLQPLGIERHPIVADVSSQLCLEGFPYIGQSRSISDSTCREIHLGQFGAQTFAARFELGHHVSFA